MKLRVLIISLVLSIMRVLDLMIVFINIKQWKK